MGDQFPATLLGRNDRYIDPASGLIRQVVRADRARHTVRVVHVDGSDATFPLDREVTILDRDEAS